MGGHGAAPERKMARDEKKRAEYLRRYKQEHRQEIRAWQTRRYATDKEYREKVKKVALDYYHDHREERLEKQKRYYRENREEILKRRAQRRKERLEIEDMVWSVWDA